MARPPTVSTHRAPAALCAICGRHMPHNAPAGSRRCSARCRATRLGALDRRLEADLVARLARRARGATLCPSETARAVLGEGPGLAAAGMQRTRSAARRLVAAGHLEVLQGGRVVDPSFAKGPIRLRLTPAGVAAAGPDAGAPGEP